MPFTNVDNLKKMKENVKKNEFPKIAGYKINLPFGAARSALQNEKKTILKNKYMIYSTVSANCFGRISQGSYGGA